MRRSLFLLSFLIVINFFSWSLLLYLKDDSLRVVFFDVEQGDAIFIKTPQNHHILIDGGAGSVVLEGLGREMPFFYNKIDLIVLTHPHDDHVSGLIEVIDRYNVKDIICTGVVGGSAVNRRWSDIINNRGYRPAKAGQRVLANNFSLNILYPIRLLQEVEVRDLNQASIISWIAFKDKYNFVFMGDAYKEQEEVVVNYLKEKELFFEADVLKVGHHGSRTSTSEVFLEALSPKIAVIMAGEDNRYGHPHQETLDILSEYGIKVLRTDRDGDIIFEMK